MRARIVVRRRPKLEVLEDRTVPSTFDIIQTTFNYTASSGINNVVTFDAGNGGFVLTDSGETITLTPRAVAHGWQSSDANTVFGPASSVSGGIKIQLLDGLDSIAFDQDVSLGVGLFLQSGQSIGLNARNLRTSFNQSYLGDLTTLPGTTTLYNESGQISFGGAINPGGPGILGTIELATASKTTLHDTDNLNVDLDGASGSDLLVNTNIGGGTKIDLGGAALNLNVISSELGDVYTIVKGPANSLTGTFAHLPDGSVVPSAGRTFIIHYTKSMVTLTDAQLPEITSAAATTFTAGSFGSFAVQAAGFPVPGLSETGALPAGVAFMDNGDGTGSLSGTAAQGSGGIHDIKIIASVNGFESSQDFVLTVNQAPAISSDNGVAFFAGKPGSFTLSANGYPAPSFDVPGALPKGLQFVDHGDGTATISGSPAAGTGGLYHYLVTASNGVGAGAQQMVTLTDFEAPTITSANKTILATQEEDSFVFEAIGYPPPSLSEEGVLPAGLSFSNRGDGTALLQGKASQYGIFRLKITASNAISPSTSQAFVLTVSGIPDFVTTSNQRFIAQVYNDLLQAVVDAGGLTFWNGALDRGVSRAQVVLAIERSGSNAFQSQEVRQLYTSYLRRSVDLPGLEFMVASLNRGVTLPQVSAQILSSPEYYQKLARNTDEGFLEALYLDVLKRPIESSAVARGLVLLAKGVSRADLALSVLTSPEANQNLAQSAYRFLNRPADSAGLAFFAQALSNGTTYEELLASILGSLEYFHKQGA